MRTEDRKTYDIVFTGVMAAIIFAVTYLRVPFFGSKLHFANAMCLLAGLLFGPVTGGLAAGIGSALYDLAYYDAVQVCITFVSKFAMAWVCGKLAGTARRDFEPGHLRLAVSCVTGAFTYVGLYMLKTFVYQRYVYGFAPDAVLLTMMSKLPASLINAVTALIAAPIFYRAVRPAIRRLGR